MSADSVRYLSYFPVNREEAEPIHTRAYCTQ